MVALFSRMHLSGCFAYTNLYNDKYYEEKKEEMDHQEYPF